VSLNIPLATIVQQVGRVLPGKRRLGVIRSASTAGPPPSALASQGDRNGFTIRVVDCEGPDKLIEAFLSLSNEADLIWCQPDSMLYNAATIKPLVLASLRHRLPIIGFSAAFVTAGAAVGIYPDFRATGWLAC